MRQNLAGTRAPHGCESFALLMAVPLLCVTAGVIAQDAPSKKNANAWLGSQVIPVERASRIESFRQLHQPENSIALQVRYPQRYGYAGTTDAFGEVGPYSCDAFAIDATPTTTGPRRNDREQVLIKIGKGAPMRSSGGMYICDYLVSYLPLDQAIAVRASIGSPRHPSIEAWVGGAEAQPPQGQYRAVADGARHLMLSANQPRAEAIFEMAYTSPPLKALPVLYERLPPKNFPGAEVLQRTDPRINRVDIQVGRDEIADGRASRIETVILNPQPLPPRPDPVQTLTVPAPPARPDPPICAHARQARTRNSPATPSLESRCRAAGGTL